jgi:hypothetical protein
MGLIDNRGRLFGRINVIDFIVIVVVILFLAGVAYTRLKPGNLQGIEPTTIEVTFLVPNVRGPSINAPELGDIVRESKTNQVLGELVSKEDEPANLVIQMPDGRFWEMNSQTRRDMFLTIRGSGRVSDNLIQLGGQEVRIGTPISIKTRIYAFQSTVWDINLNPQGTGSQE